MTELLEHSILVQHLRDRELGGRPAFSTVRCALPAATTLRVQFFVPSEETWVFIREKRDIMPGVIYEECVRDGEITFPRALLESTNMVMDYLSPYFVYTDLWCDFENSSATQTHIVEITFEYMKYNRQLLRLALREMGIEEPR